MCLVQRAKGISGTACWARAIVPGARKATSTSVAEHAVRTRLRFQPTTTILKIVVIISAYDEL
jgi:hypothetical protein